MADEQQQGRDLVHRYPGNPLMTVEDLDFQCADIYNAGVLRTDDHVLLLITIEALEGRCNIHLARSRDGRRFAVGREPLLRPSKQKGYAEYESLGVRDPRITPFEDQYYVTYLAESQHGFRPALARTKDFRRLERLGFLAEPDAKAAALFPRKINDRYALLYRPGAGASIWIKYSQDLTFWGQGRIVLAPRPGFWDSDRIGAAAPPIELDDSWLLIYYGAKETTGGPLYRLGAALLEKDDPAWVLHRLNIPLLGPREMYERVGDVGNLIFSCGALLAEDALSIYYGGADSCLCLGTVTLDTLRAACRRSEEEF